MLRIVISGAAVLSAVGVVAGHWASGPTPRAAHEVVPPPPSSEAAGEMSEDLRAAIPQRGPSLPRPEVVRALRRQ